MRLLALLSCAAFGCSVSDGGMPDLATRDLAIPDQTVTISGTIYDFVTQTPSTMSLHIQIYPEVCETVCSPWPWEEQQATGTFSVSSTSPPASGVLFLLVSGQGVAPTFLSVIVPTPGNYQIDTYAVPSKLATTTAEQLLALLFTDPAPPAQARPLANLHPAEGALFSDRSAQYVAASRDHIDATARATTSSGAALLSYKSQTFATRGSCDGGCNWPSEIPFLPIWPTDGIFLEPIYQN